MPFRRRLKVPVVLFAACSIAGAFAQGDPRNQDSLITRSVSYLPYRPGIWSIAYIDMDFVTDDSIIYFQIPLRWSSADRQIYVGHVVWRDLVLLWDEHFDSLDMADERIVLTGICDLGGPPNPPLNTSGVRRNQIDLRMVITPQAAPQEVVIDTVVDRPYNSLLFGLPEGIDFVPAFVKTSFRYGMPTGIDCESADTMRHIRGLTNFPNPFNVSTTFSFSLGEAGDVILEIYDVNGRLVRTLAKGEFESGDYRIVWDGKGNDGSECASGVFLCRFAAGEKKSYHKVVLVR